MARQARAAHGLTIEDLAARTQVSRATIQRAERGEGVSRTTAEVLAKALGLALGSVEVPRETPGYHSVFISYGGPDEAFARLLWSRLARLGIKVFFFPESATPGQRLHRTMATAVLEYDRIILLCSAASLDRPGVLYEIEQVLSREAAEGGEELLIPLAIDDHVFVNWQPKRPDLRAQVLSRVVADFRGVGSSGPDLEGRLARLVHALTQD
jgi:transcriptional regulator with XRE-family HTH domain